MNSVPPSSHRVRHAWRLLILLVSLQAVAAQPKSVTAGDLTIAAAWAHATAPGATTGAAYLTIESRSQQLESLLRATSPVAGEMTFQRTSQRDGVSRTDPLWSVDIPAGRTVKFEPTGRHLVLAGLKQPLAAGTYVSVTLHFQHAGDVTIQVEIVPATASGPVAKAGPAAAP
jgi:periplasmic copper chaperone A